MKTYREVEIRGRIFAESCYFAEKFNAIRLYVVDITERKRAEEEIRKFKTICDRAGHGVGIIDLQGNLLYVNGSFAEMHGYTAEELIGKHFSILHTEEQMKKVGSLKKQLEQAGTYVDEEVWHKRKDGTVFPTLMTGTSVTDDKGKPLYLSATAIDITARKRAEEALRESEERFRIAAETANDVVYEWDLKQSVQWQGKLDELLGYGPGEFPRTLDAWASSLHPEDAERTMAAIQAHLEGRAPYAIEYRVRRKDGVYRWWSARGAVARTPDGKPVRWIGTITDITERKRAEEALRKSESAYRELADSITDVFFAFDQGLRYTYWNKASEILTGIPAEEAIGKSLLEIFPDTPEIRRAEQVYFEVLRTKRPQSLVNQTHIGGKLHVFEINAYPAERGISVFVKDITDRKRAEEALHQSEERLRLVLDGLGSQMFVGLMDTEGVLLMANRPAMEAAALRPEEVVGKPCPETYWWSYSEAVRQRLRAAIQRAAQGEPVRYDEQVRVAEGQLVWIDFSLQPLRDESGKVVFLIPSANVITERKKAEEALRESEERFRTIFEGTPIGITIHTVDGGYKQTNPAFQQMLGYTEEELRNLSVSQVTHLEDMEGGHRLFQEIIEGKRPYYQRTKRYVRKDGGVIWVQVIRSVRRDASGKVVDAFSLVQDITDRRQAEERLHAHHKRLRALASELSVVEARERRRLASYLHDHIGQNLAIAKIKLGELRQSASSRGMAASLDGIRNLLDETIQETRSLTFDLSPPILYELGFEPAVEWLTERMQKEHGLPCRFEDDGQAKPLEEDLRAVLFRSVRELLVNVVKHAHARSAKVSLRKEGGDMRIVVEDDGVGFESSGAELYPGQSGGFGLFSILERLTYFGGRVHIESEPGRGTRITLVAPLAPNERVRSGRAYPKGKE